jgi:hypothetical protein
MAPNAGGAPLTHRFSYQRDFGLIEDFTAFKAEARKQFASGL